MVSLTSKCLTLTFLEVYDTNKLYNIIVNNVLNRYKIRKYYEYKYIFEKEKYENNLYISTIFDGRHRFQ